MRVMILTVALIVASCIGEARAATVSGDFAPRWIAPTQYISCGDPSDASSCVFIPIQNPEDELVEYRFYYGAASRPGGGRGCPSESTNPYCDITFDYDSVESITEWTTATDPEGNVTLLAAFNISLNVVEGQNQFYAAMTVVEHRGAESVYSPQQQFAITFEPSENPQWPRGTTIIDLLIQLECDAEGLCTVEAMPNN